MTYFFDKDDAGHWYMIPSELQQEWIRLNVENEEDDYEEFEEKFGNYHVGGGIENIHFIPQT